MKRQKWVLLLFAAVVLMLSGCKKTEVGTFAVEEMAVKKECSLCAVVFTIGTETDTYVLSQGVVKFFASSDGDTKIRVTYDKTIEQYYGDVYLNNEDRKKLSKEYAESANDTLKVNE